MVSMRNKEAYDGISPRELQRLVFLFRLELISALKNKFQVANEAGPGVMRLSIGLTGVESPNQILAGTSTFTPIGLSISFISRVVSGEHTNVGSASMELVGSDSVSNKPLFAALDRRAGGRDFKKLIDPLSDAKEAFKWWAKRLQIALEGKHLPPR